MTKPNCPYCGQPAELCSGGDVYPHRPDLRDLLFWVCGPCDAYVGCHPAGKHGGDGSVPKGSLANAALRRLRRQAHAVFDPLWLNHRDRRTARTRCYNWLAKEMDLSVSECHIGLFNDAQCERVIQLCQGVQK